MNEILLLPYRMVDPEFGHSIDFNPDLTASDFYSSEGQSLKQQLTRSKSMANGLYKGHHEIVECDQDRMYRVYWIQHGSDRIVKLLYPVFIILDNDFSKLSISFIDHHYSIDHGRMMKDIRSCLVAYERNALESGAFPVNFKVGGTANGLSIGADEYVKLAPYLAFEDDRWKFQMKIV